MRDKSGGELGMTFIIENKMARPLASKQVNVKQPWIERGVGGDLHTMSSNGQTPISLIRPKRPFYGFNQQYYKLAFVYGLFSRVTVCFLEE